MSMLVGPTLLSEFNFHLYTKLCMIGLLIIKPSKLGYKVGRSLGTMTDDCKI